MGDSTSGVQLLGYAASMAGFSLYTMSKWTAAQDTMDGKVKKAL